MTLEQFYARLRRVKRKWRVGRGGEIRCIYRKERCCPVVAVAREGGHDARGLDVIGAGTALGLSRDEIILIADAADDLPPPLGWGLFPHKSVEVRRTLLRACGLA